MIHQKSNLSSIQEHCASFLSANFRLTLEGIFRPSVCLEHIELALNTLSGDIESLRRELVKQHSILPLSAPFRVRVLKSGDKTHAAEKFVSELLERWPGLANGRDEVNGADLAKDLGFRIKQYLK